MELGADVVGCRELTLQTVWNDRLSIVTFVVLAALNMVDRATEIAC